MILRKLEMATSLVLLIEILAESQKLNINAETGRKREIKFIFIIFH